ncbi:hypothetical protein [Lipingzhangella rawalii]|nr:hypothetical protein [Lipingzhangella rawalii]
MQFSHLLPLAVAPVFALALVGCADDGEDPNTGDSEDTAEEADTDTDTADAEADAADSGDLSPEEAVQELVERHMEAITNADAEAYCATIGEGVGPKHPDNEEPCVEGMQSGWEANPDELAESQEDVARSEIVTIDTTDDETGATVEVGINNPVTRYGQRLELEQTDGEWFVVNLETLYQYPEE